jgi:hypothetical protein
MFVDRMERRRIYSKAGSREELWQCGEVGINERRKVGMRLEGTNVSVMPIEFTSAANGGVQDLRELSDVEAIYRNNAYVYQVRQGKCIQLRLQNNGEEEFCFGWDCEELVDGRERNGSGVRLRAGGVDDMTSFPVRGSAIDVAFSDDDHAVLLRMRFENVADDGSGGSGGGHVPEGIMAQTVRMRGRRVRALLARLAALRGFSPKDQ